MTEAPAKLGIIAGGGELPLRLASACRDAGRAFHVLAIEGFAGEKASDFPHSWIALGSVGLSMKILKSEGCREVVFAGVVKRPDFGKLKLDWRGARLLPRMVSAAREGDDALLKVLLAEFEREGFKVVGADQVFGGLLAKAQVMTHVQPSERDRFDIARAVEVVRTLGKLDIGQGAIVCDGLVLAVEAAEGTDAMLERCAMLPPEIRGRSDARRGVLVKLPKPAQEKRVDLPVIGVSTVERAAKAGLSGIAVAAGAALIIDEAETVAAADRLGIFIAGIAVASAS